VGGYPHIERFPRPGPYTGVWSVISAEDEHPETNQFGLRALCFGDKHGPSVLPPIRRLRAIDGAIVLGPERRRLRRGASLV